MNDASAPKTRVTSVLDDPSTQAVARMYAVALLDAAQSKGVSGVEEDINSFVTDVLDSFPGLENLLSSKIVSRDDKLGLIDRVVKPQASQVLTDFLQVLASHERLDIVRNVALEVNQEVQRRLGRKTVSVTAAAFLSDQAIQSIKSRLSSQLSFEPELDITIDPGILGGLIIQIDDSVFDSSLRSRLNQMRGQLRERYLNEIQSGRDRFGHTDGN